MASKFNRYYKELMADKAILWLKANDPNYSNKTANKGLDYPYLTKRKELIREHKEIPFSSLNGRQKNKCRSKLDMEYDNE
jgi:hypothetical protein